MQCRCVQFDRAERQRALERLAVAKGHLQSLPCKQGRACGIAGFDVAQSDLAAKHDGRSGTGRHPEIKIELARCQALMQPERQRLRQVTQKGLQIEVAHPELQRGRTALGEWGRLRSRVEGGSIQLERQARLDLDVDVGRQVGQEWQAQVDRCQAVNRIDGPVLENHRPVAQLQVVESEQHRRGCRGRRFSRLETGDQVIDVVATVCRARQSQFRPIDLECLDHRSTAQQRADVGVDVEACDLQKRRDHCRRGRLVGWHATDRDAAHGQFERPRAEIDFAERDGPAQGGTKPLLCLRLQQRWHGQPRQRPQAQQSDHRPRKTSQPLQSSTPHGLKPATARDNPSGAAAPSHHGQLPAHNAALPTRTESAAPCTAY